MADYAKKKNDELAALCKERGLAHTGKKAELVKRLEDYDAESGDSAAAAATTTTTTTTEDNAPTQASETKADVQPADDNNNNKTKAAEPTGAASEATNGGSNNIQQDGEPAQKEGETTSQNFALGLQETTLDEEIAKRKKRAEKFGMDVSQDETLKLLERAKRFGSNNVPGLLNQALPERAERKKRGRDGRDERDDRKRSRQRGNQDRPQKEQKDAKTDGVPSWMTDKDREAAERRKAKFARAD